MISISAIAIASKSSLVACVVLEWGVLLGYTMALCPILIKVQAINKLARYAKRFRRLEIDGNKLKLYPLFVLLPIMLYLTIWVIVDMPKPTKTLTIDPNNENGSLVNVNIYCTSSSSVWVFVSYVWQLLLLSIASVLAFRSRDVMEQMK